jgi:type IV pili sensor histidine kinase/response regulator
MLTGLHPHQTGVGILTYDSGPEGYAGNLNHRCVTIPQALKRSGYRLCEPTPAIADLYALPLPAAHLHLGPLTLRDALLTLVGPAWDVNVDDRARQVCFAHPGEAPDSPAADAAAVAPVTAPTAGAAQTFPLASGEQP